MINQEYQEWFNIHKNCECGVTTFAYFGLQWDRSRKYHSVYCHCGSHFIIENAGDKPIIKEHSNDKNKS